MTTRTLRRRGIAAAALVSLVALTFAACGGDDDLGGAVRARPRRRPEQADGRRLQLGRLHAADDIAEQVEEETGAKVEITEHATNEDMVAKVIGSGGEGLDVVFGSQPYLQAFAEEGLLEPLDTDYLENWDSLDPEAQGLAEVDDQPYFAPYTWGTTGICYRSDLVDEAPTSWNDLLAAGREQYRRQDHDDGHRALGCAAGAEGARLLGQHHRRGRDGGGQGAAARGQAPPARLRRHHVLRAADQRRGRDGRGLGRLVQLRHRREPRHQVRRARGGLATSGSTAWSS